jgi:hypothetical protein
MMERRAFLTAACGLMAGASVRSAAAMCDCLNRTGPLVIVSGDKGYAQYRPALANNSKVNAWGAKWNQRTTVAPKQPYPVIVTGSNCCWIGGDILGTNSKTIGWNALYNAGNSAAFFIGGSSGSAPNFCLEQLRIDNCWDGIRIGPGGTGWRVTGCYITYNRDDAFENDQDRSGTISDCLVDGTYGFYSSRNAGTQSGTEVLIEKCLVYMQPLPVPSGCAAGSVGYGTTFKLDGNSPKLRLRDNIFLITQAAHNGNPFVNLANFPSKVAESAGNTIVWTGGGSYPWPTPAGFAVTTSRSVYDKAKSSWLSRYTNVR